MAKIFFLFYKHIPVTAYLWFTQNQHPVKSSHVYMVFVKSCHAAVQNRQKSTKNW